MKITIDSQTETKYSSNVPLDEKTASEIFEVFDRFDDFFDNHKTPL